MVLEVLLDVLEVLLEVLDLSWRSWSCIVVGLPEEPVCEALWLVLVLLKSYRHHLLRDERNHLGEGRKRRRWADMLYCL